MFENKTAILFDFDGTIADTFSLHERAFREALGQYEVQFQYADFIGMSTNETIAEIFRQNGKPLPPDLLKDLVKEKRRLANASYMANVVAFPGAVEFIQLLHAGGIQLFIGSSGSRMNITAGVSALNIGQYFIDIVTADDVVRSKPHPEIFLTLLERHKIDPGAALVIEDAASGLEAAARAGVDAVCVNPDIREHPLSNCRLLSAGFDELILEFKSFGHHEKNLSSGSNLQ